MIPFLANLLLALVWAALMGSTSPVVFATGFVLGYIILSWLRPLPDSASYARKLPSSIGLAAFFAWELMASTLRVAWDVVTPQRLRRPGIVAVPLDARTDAEITLLACLVTLTPGSLSLDVSEDRTRLYVHAMFVDDPQAIRDHIKTGFERRILEIMR
jgi:multicomponent Na+:H+ antiporter subunit E